MDIKRYYYENGNIKREIYLLNRKCHRENGPAVISYYENGNLHLEEYLQNNKRHREDGPAYISYYENGNIIREEYWLNDILYGNILKYMVAVGSLK